MLVCAVVILFLLQVGARLYTRVPWCDEGFFADPATSLLVDRTLGSRAADPNGVWIIGDKVQQIHQYFNFSWLVGYSRSRRFFDALAIGDFRPASALVDLLAFG